MKNKNESLKNFTLMLVILMSIFAAPLRVFGDKLTVYVYPSPTGINWTSPNTLAWSTVGSMLVTDSELQNIHAIGHMNFDLSCDASEELPNGSRIVTGQTSQGSSEEITEIFKKSYGLNVFLTPVAGRWETQQEIEADLPIRMRRGSIAYIDFAITPKTCGRVVEYLKQYKQLGFDQIYGGLQSQPRYGEGAGCSAFVESVLEIAGLMDPIWKNYFSHPVLVPNSLLGGPNTGQKVSFLDLLFGINSLSWESSTKNAYALDFWDPYYVYYWIEQAVRRPLLLKNFKYTSSHNQKAHGISIDARSAPTPTEGFWLKP